MKYIVYARVSTDSQNNGLESQQKTIDSYISNYGGEIIDSFFDKESGAKNDRKGLNQALSMCKRHKATLLVAKLDRVSRRVSFIASLMESNIPLKVAELPNADAFQLHIWSALAEAERKLISSRTKAALDILKSKGVKLGSPLNDATARQAREFAKTIVPHIDQLRKSGIKSWSALASKLNDMGVKTQTGGVWYHSNLKKVASYV